jgi:hypothetical protein
MAINRVENYVPETDTFATSAIDSRPTGSSTLTLSSDTSGWVQPKEFKQSTTVYDKEFKPTENSFQIIKFFGAGPFCRYKEHYIKEKTVGKRSFICPTSIDSSTKCPICATNVGKLPDDQNIPSEKYAFTVLNLSWPEGPKRQQWIVGGQIYKILYPLEHSPQGPLSRNYWAVNRTGPAGLQAKYTVQAVKGRDLAEDWQLDEALAEKAVSEVVPFTGQDILMPTNEQLIEAASYL